jgi:hypothetical protein
MSDEVTGKGAEQKPRVMLPRALRSPEENAAADAAMPTGPAPRQRPFPWKVFVLIALAAAGGLVMLNRMNEDAKIQDCVMAGHKNCVKLDPGLGR